MLVNNYKKKAIVVVIVLCFAMILLLIGNSYAYNSSERNVLDWETIKVPIRQVELKGFNNSSYILKEYEPSGYSISTDNGITIERSETSKSPYLSRSGELFYGGPTYYYEKEIDNEVTDLFRQESISISNDLISKANVLSVASKQVQPMPRIGSGTDSGEVASADFIKNLNTSSFNTVGTCGYVAASIMLAYYDYRYPSKGIATEYRLANNQISKSLHDKLRSYGKKDASTADTIKPVVKKYLDNRGVSGIKHFTWLGLFTTNAMLSDSIDKNNPVIIFGSLYNPASNGNVTHALVVYKYFLRLYDNGAAFWYYTCHYGWGPEYNSIEVNNNVADFLVGTSYYLNIK